MPSASLTPRGVVSRLLGEVKKAGATKSRSVEAARAEFVAAADPSGRGAAKLKGKTLALHAKMSELQSGVTTSWSAQKGKLDAFAKSCIDPVSVIVSTNRAQLRALDAAHLVMTANEDAHVASVVSEYEVKHKIGGRKRSASSSSSSSSSVQNPGKKAKPASKATAKSRGKSASSRKAKVKTAPKKARAKAKTKPKAAKPAARSRSRSSGGGGSTAAAKRKASPTSQKRRRGGGGGSWRESHRNHDDNDDASAHELSDDPVEESDSSGYYE